MSNDNNYDFPDHAWQAGHRALLRELAKETDMITIGDDTRNVLDIELGPQQSLVVHVNASLHDVEFDGVDVIISPKMVRADDYEEVQ